MRMAKPLRWRLKMAVHAYSVIQISLVFIRSDFRPTLGKWSGVSQSELLTTDTTTYRFADFVSQAMGMWYQHTHQRFQEILVHDNILVLVIFLWIKGNKKQQQLKLIMIAQFPSDCQKWFHDYDCYAYWLAYKCRASFSTNEKQNQNQSHLESARHFSRPLSKLQVIARNSDWFITLFAPVKIGRRNYFSNCFFDRHLKTAL